MNIISEFYLNTNKEHSTSANHLSTDSLQQQQTTKKIKIKKKKHQSKQQANTKSNNNNNNDCLNSQEKSLVSNSKSDKDALCDMIEKIQSDRLDNQRCELSQDYSVSSSYTLNFTRIF